MSATVYTHSPVRSFARRIPPLHCARLRPIRNTFRFRPIRRRCAVFSRAHLLATNAANASSRSLWRDLFHCPATSNVLCSRDVTRRRMPHSGTFLDCLKICGPPVPLLPSPGAARNRKRHINISPDQLSLLITIR